MYRSILLGEGYRGVWCWAGNRRDTGYVRATALARIYTRGFNVSDPPRISLLLHSYIEGAEDLHNLASRIKLLQHKHG